MALTSTLGASALAAALALAGCAWNDDLSYPAVPRSFYAPMNAAQEVPPTNSSATGAVFATLFPDGTLHWDAAYSGLTGWATAVYFHGPAGPGVTAPPIINIGALGVAPRMRGSAHLTEAQVADLMRGLWYASILTHANPNGEIRGRVIFTP